MQTATPEVRDDRTIDLRSQSTRPAARPLGSTDLPTRWGITALLAVIGLVHLHLWWQEGYRSLPTIGPLFLVAVFFAGFIALFTSVQLNWVTAATAACFAAGTLVANLASLLLPHGLFEFKEVGVSYSGAFAIGSELGVVVLFGVWAYSRLRSSGGLSRRRLSNRTRAHGCSAHR